MTRSTSARALATTSSIRPGWIRPSLMSFVIASRAISRRTGSNPLRTTVSGVSSMIRSMPVACSRARMLRPSRPMIRPFISSDGRWMTVTVCSAVWSAATRWMAVTMMSRAFSSAVLAGAPLDRPGELDGVVLGLLADGVEEDRLGVLAGQAADPLERLDLLLVGAGDVLAGLVDARARGRSAFGRGPRACRPAGRAARRAGGAGARGWPARSAWPGPRPPPRAGGGSSPPSPRG